jgi:hypothetical protein
MADRDELPEAWHEARLVLQERLSAMFEKVNHMSATLDTLLVVVIAGGALSIATEVYLKVIFK